MTNDTERGIRGFLWGHDNPRVLYIQDQGGDENWRLYDIDLATGVTRDLTPFEDVQAQLVAYEKGLPDELLVGLNQDNPQLHDVYHLELETGELEKVVENPGVIGWVADADLRVRAGLQPRPDGGMNLVGRGPAPAEEWEVLLDRLRRRPGHRPHGLNGGRPRPLPAVVGGGQRQPAAAHRSRRPARPTCWPRTRIRRRAA